MLEVLETEVKIETLTNLLPNGLLELIEVQNNQIINVKYININDLVKYLETNHQEAKTFAS